MVMCVHADPCRQGDVRLQDGTATSGRVEVCNDNVWGTVCDDFWDDFDARVVCIQLGLPSSGLWMSVLCCFHNITPHSYTAATAVSGGSFPRGRGPIWLDNVKCRGHEATLVQCQHPGFGVHNCKHSEDAGVKCRGTVLKLQLCIPEGN